MYKSFFIIAIMVVVTGCIKPKSPLKDAAKQPVLDYAVFEDLADLAKKYGDKAINGDKSAQYNLGYLYSKGPKNYVQAKNWYTKSATQGHAKAQNNLAILYASGNGTGKDYKIAYMWFNISLANGYDEAIKGKYALQIKMSKNDRIVAQKMAIQCVKSKYKAC